MPVHLDDFISLLAEICEEQGLKVAVSESAKGALITGTFALLGGLLLGPFGIALGGAVGGTASAISAKNKFQSVSLILLKMPRSRKQRLYEKFISTFRNVGVMDLVTLMALLEGRRSIRGTVVELVRNFVTNELQYKVA